MPSVFISYCWTSPDHEEWVINLAQRLVSDGIDVKIDKWDLKEGQDKYDFMESMVKDININKVLIILDRKYSEKADARAGGVGTETQIISDKVYNDVSQEKFIPIVTEIDDKGNPFLPSYLKTRIYIDMSIDDQFEQNYEKLLRNLYQRPIYSKPKMGNPPFYLFEETHKAFTSSTILNLFDATILKNPKQVNTLLRDFLDNFFNDVRELSVNIDHSDYNTIGKSIIDNINSYTPLRDNFVKFLNKLIRSQLTFDYEIIIRFFEKQPLLLRPQDGRGSWTSIEFDNFRFIIHELFLYLISLCLKNERYELISEFLYSKYFFKNHI